MAAPLDDHELRRVFDDLPAAVVVRSADGRVAVVNAAFAECTGCEPDELVGGVAPYGEPTDAGASAFRAELRRTDGQALRIDVARARAGPWTIDVVSEVTRGRDLERRLREEAGSTTLARLAGRIAHELNNPLAAILGTVELLLLEAPPDTPLGERLRRIDASGGEIRGIARGLAELARADDDRRIVDLRTAVEDALRLLGRGAVDAPAARVAVAARAADLRQLLVHLLANATGEPEQAPNVDVEVDGDQAVVRAGGARGGTRGWELRLPLAER